MLWEGRVDKGESKDLASKRPKCLWRLGAVLGSGIPKSPRHPGCCPGLAAGRGGPEACPDSIPLHAALLLLPILIAEAGEILGERRELAGLEQGQGFAASTGTLSESAAGSLMASESQDFSLCLLWVDFFLFFYFCVCVCVFLARRGAAACSSTVAPERCRTASARGPVAPPSPQPVLGTPLRRLGARGGGPSSPHSCSFSLCRCRVLRVVARLTASRSRTRRHHWHSRVLPRCGIRPQSQQLAQAQGFPGFSRQCIPAAVLPCPRWV